MGKYKSAIFLGVMVLFILGNLYAEEINLNWRKDSNDLLDIIYGETELTVKEAKKLGVKNLDQKNESDTVKAKYSKVVVTKEMINFYDEKGKIKKEIELGNKRAFITSTNKKLIALRKFDIVSGNTNEMTIYNQEGSLKGEFKIKPLNGIEVADDGSFVVFGNRIGSMPQDGTIYFYDTNGRLIKEIMDLKFPHNIKYSPDNSFLIVLVIGKKIAEYEGEYPIYLKYPVDIVCYDKRGEKIWNYTIKEMSAIGLSNMYFTKPHEMIEFSNNSKLIYVRGQSRKEKKITFIFDINGKLIEERDGWE